MTRPDLSLDTLKRLFLEKALLGGSGDQVVVTNTPASAIPVDIQDTHLATEVTLAALLTELNEKYEGGPISVANFPATQPVSGAVTAESALAKKIGEGKFWIAGHNVTTETLNPQAVFSLVNPAKLADGITNNTKNMFVVKIAVDAASSGQIVFVRNQTSNPNAIREAFNPNTYFDGQPNGEFHAGNLLPAGGVTISPTRKVFANSTYEFEGLVILKPGQTFSARVTGAATGSQMSGLVHWYEE